MNPRVSDDWAKPVSKTGKIDERRRRDYTREDEDRDHDTFLKSKLDEVIKQRARVRVENEKLDLLQHELAGMTLGSDNPKISGDAAGGCGAKPKQENRNVDE